MTIGPFDVAPERVSSLGGAFTEFVNRLLDVQVRAQNISGHLLAITSEENTPDGGVDAALRDAHPSDWLPGGTSAWQFKRGDLQPKRCADEFAEATWVHQLLREDGSYILALGKQLPDRLVESRRNAIFAQAVALGLINEDERDRIRVYDANRLARWASQLPQLALSSLVGGAGGVAMNYETWASGRPHGDQFVPDEARRQAIEMLQTKVSSPGIVDIRIQGDSGIGKTRLALEAFRDGALAPLVIYVQDGQNAGPELFAYLLEQPRAAVLVVDECPAERHVKLLEMLPQDPSIRLVTIGDVGAPATASPVVVVDVMPEQELDEFLGKNYQLSPEARRFVAHVCEGNMRYAIVLAQRILRLPGAQAAEIIQRGDIESILSTLLPEGEDFFFAALLALLERVGWERELEPQLKVLARFADAPAARLMSVGRELEERGLLVRQGRYRAVSPHPLAIFLAASGWRRDGDRIMRELLPSLSPEMALSLFRRAADLGRFEPARSVLPRLLNAGGPFATLQEIETSGLGPLITQLAIVLPDEMTLHLGELIEAASLEQLEKQTKSRRDLVWTLEKLAWHRRTFVSAANSLLRLSLAENETWANNATATWAELFGTFLPGTAATPSERLEYLAWVSEDHEPRVLRAVIRAATRALSRHESIMVSGEVQGGVLVEPRGTPATFGDAGDYQKGIVAILSSLASNDDASVGEAAQDALINAVHSLIDNAFVGECLTEALLDLRGDALQRLRIEADRLLSLHTRSDRGSDTVRERIQALLDQLPVRSPLEDLAVLVRLPRWDLGDGESQARITSLVETLYAERKASEVVGLLDQEVPAAFELGHALAAVEIEALDSLVAVFDVNSTALVGYLRGMTEQGRASAFDEFLASTRARQLEPRARMWLAARGPITDESRTRLLSGVRELSVVEGVGLLLGWQEHLSDHDAIELLGFWLEHVASQEDYNALIDSAVHWLRDDESPPWLDRYGIDLVLLRRGFPGVVHQSYMWSRLALRQLASHAAEIANLILDLTDADNRMLLGQDYDAEVLGACLESDPQSVWENVASRLLAGSWRVEHGLRAWFLQDVQSSLIERWVGEDSEHARIVASIAPVGEDEPTATTRFLLDRFGSDAEVKSSLYSTFISGGWVGNESDRLTQKIEQLGKWRKRTAEPHGVREWAKQVIEMLEHQRTVALEREAERGL